MASLIQKIGTSKAHQHHLEERILNEHARKDSCYRHHVIAKLQVTRLTREHTYKHVRQHG